MHSVPRLRALLLASVLALGAAPLAAQPAPAGFEPRTGDPWVDTWLDDVNRYATAYRDPFVDELTRYHKAPRDLVLALLARPGWTPGDVYFACALAAQAGRPCRYVADEYDRDRAAGWGALAQRLGIAPGSAGFHRLKNGFAPTYQRWGRPIRLDAPSRDATLSKAAGSTPQKAGGRAEPPGPARRDDTEDAAPPRAAGHRGKPPRAGADDGKPAHAAKATGKAREKSTGKGDGRDGD